MRYRVQTAMIAVAACVGVLGSAKAGRAEPGPASSGQAPPIREALRKAGVGSEVVLAAEFEGDLRTIGGKGQKVRGRFERAGGADGVGGKVGANTPRFAPGYHGRGLLIEQASRNILSRAASGLMRNIGAVHSLGGATLQGDREHKVVGYMSIKVTTGAGRPVSGVDARSREAVDAGADVTGSVRLRGRGRARVRLVDAAHDRFGPFRYVELTPRWQRVVTQPLSLSGAGSDDLRLEVRAVDGRPVTFNMDAMQIEPIRGSTSWMPGGTARAAGRAVFPLPHKLDTMPRGTFLLRVRTRWDRYTPLRAPRQSKWNRRRVFVMGGRGDPRLEWTVYNMLRFNRIKLHANLYDDQWHLLAATWSPDHTAVYIDGHKQQSNHGSGYDQSRKWFLGPNCNAVLDQWVVLDQPLTAKQIGRIRELSSAPKASEKAEGS